jgi:hypothetical protein
MELVLKETNALEAGRCICNDEWCLVVCDSAVCVCEVRTKLKGEYFIFLIHPTLRVRFKFLLSLLLLFERILTLHMNACRDVYSHSFECFVTFCWTEWNCVQMNTRLQ